MNEAAERAKVREEIERAFLSIPYPGDRNLVLSSTSEGADFARAFKGKRWQDYRDRPLDLFPPRCREAFAFFTPQAFVHYLPAAMIACLESYDESDILPGSIVFHLASEKRASQVHRRISLLNKKQIRALVSFLRFLKRFRSREFGQGTLLRQAESAIADLEDRLRRGNSTRPGQT